MVNMLKKGMRETYTGWPELERMLRGSGHQPSRVTHLVSVEKIDEMPECHEVRARIGGLTHTIPTFAAIERHVTDDNYVGSVTRIIGTDLYTSHFELHLAARSWMMCQAYPMDFAPQSCECDGVGAGDFDWLNSTMRDVWSSRLWKS